MGPGRRQRAARRARRTSRGRCTRRSRASARRSRARPTAIQAMACPVGPVVDRGARRRSRPTGSATTAPRPGVPSRVGFGMPNLRRNVCPHFYMTGARGAIPIQAPHLLKALVRQEANVSRCQLRGGVHLEQGYVNDVCLSARFNQCVFYEDDLERRASPARQGPGPGNAGRAPVRLRRGRRRAPGARPVRHPARPRPDAGPPARPRRARSGRPRRARRRARTARAASSRSSRPASPRPGTAPARRRSRTSSRYRERLRIDGRPDRPRTRSRALVREVLPLADRVARRHGAADRVRAADGRRVRLVRPGAASTSRSSRSGSAAGSTRPTPGTAASPRSRTSTSTTPSGSARRSRRSPGRRRRSSCAATAPSPAPPARRSR